MKKPHVKVNDADCTLEVEFQKKFEGVWIFLVQIWSHKHSDSKSVMSFSLKLPEDFLREKVDSKLDRTFIELCILLAIENHADSLQELAISHVLGPIEVWIVAATKIARNKDREALLSQPVEYDDSRETFDAILGKAVNSRKKLL